MNHVLCSPENRCWHIFVGGQPSRIDGSCWTCSDAGRGMGKKERVKKKAPDAISAGRPLAAKLQIDPLGASGMLSPVPRKRSSAVFQLMTCQMFST